MTMNSSGASGPMRYFLYIPVWATTQQPQGSSGGSQESSGGSGQSSGGSERSSSGSWSDRSSGSGSQSGGGTDGSGGGSGGLARSPSGRHPGTGPPNHAKILMDSRPMA